MESNYCSLKNNLIVCDEGNQEVYNIEDGRYKRELFRGAKCNRAN